MPVYIPERTSGIGIPTGFGPSDTATQRVVLANDQFGEVQAIPTANTLLARLKTVADNLSSLLTELQAKADLAETQPVSLATLPALTAGAANIGDVDVLTLPAITGSVTANAGTNLNTSALALSATQTDRTQKTQLTDGTRDGTVKAASTLPLATDTAVVTTQRDALPAGANAIGKLAANSGVDIGDVDVTSIAAGDNNIGNVDVVTLPALVAGSAIVGKVGIDQTTPGTTNRVDIGTFPDNEPFNVSQLAGVALAAPFDADTGAGTQNLPGVSLRKAASGGSVEYGTAADPIRTDPTGVTTQPVSVATGQGKTLLFAAIAQGAAGTTTLVSADATRKCKTVGYAIVMSAAGTAKFTDGTADLTGAMDIAANGGVAMAGQPSAHLFETAAINRPLNIITTGGAARGHVSYFLEA